MIGLKTKIIAGLLVFALVASTIGVVSALNINGFSNPVTAEERPIRLCYMNNLTDEQRQDIRQMVMDLRDSGATPEEIRSEMQKLLEEMGIDIEENPGMRPNRFGPRAFRYRQMSMKMKGT